MYDSTTMHKEGKVAKAIESQTSKLPSDIFLWSGLSCLAAGFAMQVTKQRHLGLMIGLCAAPLLIMGLYDKTVKQLGHDVTDPSPTE
jgi:hypothetical protein